MKKVRATALGYCDQLRQIGDEFEVPDGLEGSWFEPVEDEDDKPKRGRKQQDRDDADPI